MTRPGSEPLLTLEPVLNAVQAGVEAAGWSMSGLQKTTSFSYEGRWAGATSRSAYLTFHGSGVPAWASVDVFLDETSAGVDGNLALVVDGLPLGSVGDPALALSRLGAVAAASLPMAPRTPVTLRLRLADGRESVAAAETEARFRVRLPQAAIGAGAAAVKAFAAACVEAFAALAADPELLRFVEG